MVFDEAGAGQTFSQVIGGSGGVTQTGNSSAKLDLNAANTYSGATTINAGTLQLAVNNAVPSTDGIACKCIRRYF